MAEHLHPDALHSAADGSWSVCARDRRLVFLNGSSSTDVPVEAPLRWACDGADLSFDEALATVPAELHGWMSLAAIIGLRHCLSGMIMAVALPAGYHDWGPLARRAEPVCAWMHTLARLDGITVPACPDGVDDGLNDYDEDDWAYSGATGPGRPK